MADQKQNDRSVQAWEALLHAHAHVLERLAKDLKEERGIDLAWYDVLYQLSSAPDQRLRLQDLATKVLYSRSGLTRLVDRMASAGLVDREPVAEDRRGTWAVLTPSGRRTFRRAAPTHVQGIEEYFGSKLTDEELTVVSKAMKRIVKDGR